MSRIINNKKQKVYPERLAVGKIELSRRVFAMMSPKQFRLRRHATGQAGGYAKQKRVFVMMSGGVDSSVAALLLKKQGYDVVGVTFDLAYLKSGRCLKLKDLKYSSCCGIGALSDAKLVAKKIGIKHIVIDARKIFKEKVIDPFINSYKNGVTPNPCVLCNQYIKFNYFLKWAKKHGADYIASGHYIKLESRIQNLEYREKQKKILNSKFYILYSARDGAKDQSYFLWNLDQKVLKNCLFPLGNYEKSKVREIAGKAGLLVADKKESQDICFIPDGNINYFLKNKISAKPGNILDLKGNITGKHNGAAFYTVGQRRGLNIALGKPVYVVGIDVKKNIIIIGNKEDCFKKEFFVNKLNWAGKKPENSSKISVKIRSQSKLIPAKIIFQSKNIKIKAIKQKFWAPARGQSAVFYLKNKEMLGGGIII